MKKPQKSGKKAPAGNKRPRRATKSLRIQKSQEKNNKKTNILKKKTSILKKNRKKTGKKQVLLAIYGHIWPYIWP